jgi:nucleotide-binding universal stress UspA family protein
VTDYKILIPLDGSRTAEHALVYLKALKAMGNCSVRLLSVADETEDFHHEHEQEALERESNLLSTYLREVARDVEQYASVAVQPKVVRGVPALRVAEEVESFQPDLVLISTHGRTGISRWRLGSVADKVVRSLTCNTLVVGPSATEDEVWIDAGIEEPFKSILVPLDGSDLGNAALPVASRFAETYSSTLHLVRVVSMMYGGSFYEGAYIPEYTDALLDGGAEQLKEAVARLDPAQARETAVLMGDPASQLESYVKERHIDLVVMTSHGRGGVLRTALGSVADRMLAEAKAPVLIVRSTK